MKKILLILTFFALSAFCASQTDALDKNQSIEDENENLIVSEKTNKGVYDLVREYVDLNKKLDEYKSDDNNASEETLERFQRRKNQILEEIPSFIVEQKIDEDKVKEFFQAKKDLENLQNKSKKNDFIYAKATLDLTYLNIIESFYKSLLEIEKLFKNNTDSTTLVKTINAAAQRLELSASFDIAEQKEKIKNPKELEEINAKEKHLTLVVSSFNEIFKYLKSNANLLESNYFFSILKLQIWIDTINDFVGISFINVGKIVVSILVIVFFASFRKLFSYLLYFFLVEIIYRNKDKFDPHAIKHIFVEKIKKPIGYLLILYAASICVSIVFYPAPVPLKISNLFYIIYAIFITWTIIVILDSYGVVFVSKFAEKSGKREIINLAVKILYFIIIIIATLFVLSQLGFNISAIIASLGIGGLAVALAAKDIIANFFASVLLLFDDSFNQGDWIRIGGIEGNVVETGLRKTSIRTFDNSLVFLPNSSIMAANIENLSRRRMGRRMKTYVGVTYDATATQLEACVKDLREFVNTCSLIAHEDDGALKYGDYRTKYRQNLVSIDDLEGYKKASYVTLSDFGESSINIELDFYIKSISGKDFREARHQILLEVMRIVEKNGLSFAFPSRSIYLENFPPKLETLGTKR